MQNKSLLFVILAVLCLFISVTTLNKFKNSDTFAADNKRSNRAIFLGVFLLVCPAVLIFMEPWVVWRSLI